MRVLVLGGYGLIGQAIMRHLSGEGHEVIGLGRNAAIGQRQAPQNRWISADIAALTDAGAWAPHLAGIEAVVNASGALQSGGRDDLQRLQTDAIVALVAASERAGIDRFVQISAPGAEADAGTQFLATKAAADAALRASSLRWTILKPGLVIAPNAYGGTALLRMLAAFPLVVPLVHADARVGTVAVEDVARCVGMSLSGGFAPGSEFELMEREPATLRDVVLTFRAWLGFGKPWAVIDVPDMLGNAVGRVADLLGDLGWRSPLRSTSLKVMKGGVTADPDGYARALGHEPPPLDSILADMPATIQERWFARMYLAFPVMIATLALFWAASGLIALAQLTDTASRLAPASLPSGVRTVLALATACLDIVLGLAILYRPTTRVACHGMILVTVLYLAAGSIIAPSLWLDPLGVFVKAIPAAVLAWVTSLLTEER